MKHHQLCLGISLSPTYLSRPPQDDQVATLLRIAAVSLEECATTLAEIRLLAAPFAAAVVVVIVVHIVVVIADRVSLGFTGGIGAVVDEAQIAGIGCQR